MPTHRAPFYRNFVKLGRVIAVGLGLVQPDELTIHSQCKCCLNHAIFPVSFCPPQNFIDGIPELFLRRKGCDKKACGAEVARGRWLKVREHIHDCEYDA